MSLSTFVTVAHLQAAIRATTSFKLETFLPHLDEAAENFMIPALSEDFFDDVIDGTVTDAKVIKLTREALINFAAAAYADTGSLNIMSTGIQEIQSDNQKPVRLEVLENFQKSKLTTGHNKLERLLAYLEKKASIFPVWAASEAYTIRTEFPISSVAEFQKYVHIRDSRRVFVALRPAMQRTLTQYITPTLDKSPVDLTALSNENKEKLQDLVKPAFAHFSMAFGINEIAVVLGKYDTILMFENTGSSKMKTYKAASEERLKALASSMETFGSQYLGDVATFLASLAPVVSEPVVTYKNDSDSHVWVIP